MQNVVDILYPLKLNDITLLAEETGIMACTVKIYAKHGRDVPLIIRTLSSICTKKNGAWEPELTRSFRERVEQKNNSQEESKGAQTNSPAEENAPEIEQFNLLDEISLPSECEGPSVVPNHEANANQIKGSASHD